MKRLNLRWGKRTLPALWTTTALALCTVSGAAAAPPPALTVLADFAGPNGAYPWDTLLQGADGAFYGTTQNGGTDAMGTVFRITAKGKLTTLASFTALTGDQPFAGLVQGPTGNLYGVTLSGGSGSTSMYCAPPYTNGCGTVFEISTTGTMNTLHYFNWTDGSAPEAKLLLGQDGNLYGTTATGGQGEGGTIFKITPDGTLTTLWNFDYSQYGVDATAPLIQLPNGDLIGTTFSGGPTSNGVVYRLSKRGEYSVVYAFTGGLDGGNPYAGLTLGKDGFLYGTTWLGGKFLYYGTAFKLSLSGKIKTLHSFDVTDGDIPNAPMLQAKDGNFYSTTSYGGPGDFGTVFKLTPKGVFSTVLSFASTNGAYAYGGLIQAKNGLIYGNAWGGGTSAGDTGCPFGCGTVYSFPVK